ncbi:hypothetical protein ONS95_005958 [Cadophora gregata]|uniref:uncharacterized protein n=1 Tax=Cadophora gregata TaxID=51156 RepID=UPI0026DA8548|nr:uncharacterized protein ONS95_005958 [Cadophora gregata]KAK0102335.1 hypothetical protein ONS95_005958 [Cadophora gregata]KAK0103961.1 hypothetical protein ONS96_005067 [Cadophora gregata f. sp. sojae]
MSAANSSTDDVVTDDFYRPANSNDYAPGDNPRKRGVRETDRFRPEPIRRAIPSLSHRRAPNGYVAGDNPTSRGVQQSDRYRPDPKLFEQEPDARISSHVLEAIRSDTCPTQGLETQHFRPLQVTISRNAFLHPILARPVSNVPNFDDGMTLFSFSDYNDLETPPEGPEERSCPSKRSESRIFSFDGKSPSDGKQTFMDDPAATRRLFGGIIKKRRVSGPSTSLPTSLLPKSGHDSNNISSYRTTDSSNPSRASQYGITQGFEVAPSDTQRMSLPGCPRVEYAALTSINPNTPKKSQASLVLEENSSHPELEKAWQMIVRQSDERRASGPAPARE